MTEIITEPTDLKLGELLRRKREELSLEVLDIAKYLKIKPQDVVAIEAEKWHEVTKHLYKTGLIRSYAKMLKIADAVIETKIKALSFESNTKNQKHRLINIGEDLDLTPNRDMFFNFLLISFLLFFVLLAIYNACEKKSLLFTNQDLIMQIEEQPGGEGDLEEEKKE